MSQYLCLFSLILQGLHKEGECRQLEFWAGKGANIRDLFCTTPKSWNSTKIIFGNNKKYWTEEIRQGGHHLPTRVGARPLPCGPPVGSPVAIFCYMKSFVQEKIISNLSGRDSATTRRNLGGTNLGLRQSCSAGDTSLREGEIITIVITNAPLIGRGQSPSTSSPAPSPLKP